MTSLFLRFWECEIMLGKQSFFGTELRDIPAWKTVSWAVGSLLRASLDHVSSFILASGRCRDAADSLQPYTAYTLPEKGLWQHWEATPVSGSLCLQGSADWESFIMSEDKRIFQLGLSQVWVKWLICSSEEYTRRLENKKQLSVCTFLCTSWCLLNARHPSKKNPADSGKTHPLQEFCLKLDWCCQPLP